MQWFRLHQEFASDPKVQMMSEIMQRRLIILFCIRCNGSETLHDTEIAFQMRISTEEWTKTKAEFVTRNFIDMNNKILNWDKRQYISDQSYQRVKKHREKMKRFKTVSETLPEQNRTESDTERDKKVLVAKTKISLDFSTGHFSNISSDKILLWKNAYPAVDIQAELRKAAVWLIENPKNKKSNYGRFLNGWFSRAQDKAPKVTITKKENSGGYSGM